MKTRNYGWTKHLWVIGGFIFCVGLFLTFSEEWNVPEIPTEEKPLEFYSTVTGEDLRETFVHAIDQAKESVTLLIFALTDKRVVYALRQKAEEGVPVTVIYDSEASRGARTKLGVKVQAVPRKSPGLMHLKLLSIDGKIAWIGTANMTPGSLHLHGNLVLGIHHPELAKIIEEKADSFLGNTDGSALHTVHKFKLPNQELELWFLPNGTQPVERLLSIIQEAKQSIQVALYTWTRKDLKNAMIDAHARGVEVTVILDRSQARGPSHEVAESLCASGMKVYLSRGDGLLHYKTMLVDDSLLVTGSANWTKAAFTKNDDCILILNEIDEEQKTFFKTFWQETIREAERVDNCGGIR